MVHNQGHLRRRTLQPVRYRGRHFQRSQGGVFIYVSVRLSQSVQGNFPLTNTSKAVTNTHKPTMIF